MPGDELPIVGLLDRVRDPLRATAAPYWRAASTVAATRAPEVHGRAASWMATISVVALKLEDRSTPIPAVPGRRDEHEGLLRPDEPGKVVEGFLHAGTHHQYDLVDACHRVQTLPGVGHHRLAGQVQEQLVDTGPHAGALPAATITAEIMGTSGQRLSSLRVNLELVNRRPSVALRMFKRTCRAVTGSNRMLRFGPIVVPDGMFSTPCRSGIGARRPGCDGVPFPFIDHHA